MILPFIAQLQYLFAQPWRQTLVYLADPWWYNPLHEIAFQEPKHAVDPFAGIDPRSFWSRRLSYLPTRYHEMPEVKCGSCGSVLQESYTLLPDQITPCPSCGSVTRISECTSTTQA